VHPASADDDVGSGVMREYEGGEIGVVGCAGELRAFWCGFLLVFVGDEVVVGGWDGGVCGAGEAVGGFAAGLQN